MLLFVDDKIIYEHIDLFYLFCYMLFCQKMVISLLYIIREQ